MVSSHHLYKLCLIVTSSSLCAHPPQRHLTAELVAAEDFITLPLSVVGKELLTNLGKSISSLRHPLEPAAWGIPRDHLKHVPAQEGPV